MSLCGRVVEVSAKNAAEFRRPTLDDEAAAEASTTFPPDSNPSEAPLVEDTPYKDPAMRVGRTGTNADKDDGSAPPMTLVLRKLLPPNPDADFRCSDEEPSTKM